MLLFEKLDKKYQQAKTEILATLSDIKTKKIAILNEALSEEGCTKESVLLTKNTVVGLFNVNMLPTDPNDKRSLTERYADILGI